MNIQSENLRALCAHVDHRAGCGKCDICLAADRVEQLEINNAELEKQRDTLLNFVERISRQKAEPYFAKEATAVIASVKGGAA